MIWTPAQLEHARADWMAGRHAREIAARFAVTPAALYGLAHRQGWPARARHVSVRKPVSHERPPPPERPAKAWNPRLVGPAIGKDAEGEALRRNIIEGDAKLLRALAQHFHQQAHP